MVRHVPRRASSSQWSSGIRGWDGLGGSETRNVKELCNKRAGKVLREHPPRGCPLRWLPGSDR